MGIIIWLIIGGVVGWLASIIMRRDAQQGIILNIVVGIVGAMIAGFFFSGGSINGAITVRSFLLSLVGAVILLAIASASSACCSEPSGSFIRIDTSLGLPNCWMIGSP